MSEPPIATLTPTASSRCSGFSSIASSLRDSPTGTHVRERAHQHAPATGIVDIDQPVRPVRTGRTIHNSLCDPIRLRSKRTQSRNPSAGQIKDGITAPAHAMEVVTLDGH